MKYLSHFTLRAFVVIGLSLGCVKAQMKKEEVMLYFKGIDMEKIGRVYELVGSYVKEGSKKVNESYEHFYDRKTMGPIKVVFHENSLVFIYSGARRLYSYQHIKRLWHNKNSSGETLWMKQ